MSATPKPKPVPVIVSQKCSVCDQPWHEDDPTLTGCLAALKDALREARAGRKAEWTSPIKALPVGRNAA